MCSAPCGPLTLPHHYCYRLQLTLPKRCKSPWRKLGHDCDREPANLCPDRLPAGSGPSGSYGMCSQYAWVASNILITAFANMSCTTPEDDLDLHLHLLPQPRQGQSACSLDGPWPLQLHQTCWCMAPPKSNAKVSLCRLCTPGSHCKLALPAQVLAHDSLLLLLGFSLKIHTCCKASKQSNLAQGTPYLEWQATYASNAYAGISPGMGTENALG